MTTAELAKELDGLARTLRGMSSEAQATVATKLELEFARNVSGQTLGGIVLAIAAAQRAAGPRARELRKDVYENRVERLSDGYAAKIAGLARAHANAIPGEILAFRYTNRPAGTIWYGDAGANGKTMISAEIYAWYRAARYAVARLIPAYGRRELDRAAALSVELVGNEGGAENADRRLRSWEIAEQYLVALDKWVDENAQLRVRLEANGKVAQVWGIDPKPYSDLVDAIAAGNSDPIGIFKRTEVAHA